MAPHVHEGGHPVQARLTRRDEVTGGNAKPQSNHPVVPGGARATLGQSRPSGRGTSGNRAPPTASEISIMTSQEWPEFGSTQAPCGGNLSQKILPPQGSQRMGELAVAGALKAGARGAAGAGGREGSAQTRTVQTLGSGSGWDASSRAGEFGWVASSGGGTGEASGGGPCEGGQGEPGGCGDPAGGASGEELREGEGG